MEKKAYRGRMWKMMGKEPYLCGMCEHFSSERSKAKKFRQLADEVKQAGRKTRSVAAGIASQRLMATSRKLPDTTGAKFGAHQAVLQNQEVGDRTTCLVRRFERQERLSRHSTSRL